MAEDRQNWHITAMKFAELLAVTVNEPVFDTGLLLVGAVCPGDVRRQLSRWAAAGKILQLRRGLYALLAPYQKVKPHPFVVANHLMPASYVSAESALAYYGMIPEHVPLTVSVTTGRPGQRQTPLGSFDHRHVGPALFWGFEAREVAVGQQAYVATPEKALLDLVHLTAGGGSEEHLRGLRLQGLERLDLRRLRAFARRAGKPKLLRAAQTIEALVEEEES